MSIERILVVDDDTLMRQFLVAALTRAHYSVDLAQNGKEALALLKQNIYDLVITDMKMPDCSGMEILNKTKELAPHTIVMIITGHGTIENAVAAMKLGAFHYLLKPFTPDALETLIHKANEHLALVRENLYLREEVSSKKTPTKLIAHSPSMKKIMTDIAHIAKSQASVFIHGESGTGKEVMATAIHMHSARSERPYIRVNCAAVPDSLIESEFFGHEKGAFTGALNKRTGRFELAHKGTLLLDEVTEIPIHLQPKLLRVIQEQEFERVGGSKPLTVDVRLISTSNRNLKEAIREKALREDLYYRLNVIPIYLPPLRERKEDILPLTHFFLEQFCIDNRKEKKTLTKEAQEKLLSYDWPGNIRELANMVERLVVLNLASTIEPSHIPV